VPSGCAAPLRSVGGVRTQLGLSCLAVSSWKLEARRRCDTRELSSPSQLAELEGFGKSTGMISFIHIFFFLHSPVKGCTATFRTTSQTRRMIQC
jgi:hypothetical protein